MRVEAGWAAMLETMHDWWKSSFWLRSLNVTRGCA